MENLDFLSKRIFTLLCALLVFWCIVLPCRSAGCEKIANFTLFKMGMEQKVKQIADALSEKYSNICHQDIQSCKIKSYDLCQGTGPRTCLHNFPTPEQCLGQGLWLSDVSGVRISNVVSKSSLTDSAKKFICASAQIEPVFEKLRKENQIQYSYAYIGSSSGAIRVSPGFKQEQNTTTKRCVNYDPRKRPWYVSAITGSKTTIILLDVSKTMTTAYPYIRFPNAKTTLEVIFATLNSYDYVGVVTFCKRGKSLVFNKVVKATEDNKKRILQEIRKKKAGSGNTNYTSAIEVGMKMLENVKIQCNQTSDTVFLLLTDGYNNADKMDSFQTLQSLIQTKFTALGKNINNFKLISFVYGKQGNINYELVKQLTCSYNGIVFRIQDGVEVYSLLQKMDSYYTFLSEGIDQDNIKPLWSEFYLDAFGFGMIVSVVIPIIVTGSVNRIIGVAAIDVLLSKFEQCGFDLNNVAQQLKSPPKCFKSALTPDQLLYLRCKQGNIICSSNTTCSDIVPTPQQVCSAKISTDVFYNTTFDYSNDDDKCCDMTIKKMVILVTVPIFATISIITTLVLYKTGCLLKMHKRCHKKLKKKNQVDKQDACKDSLVGDKNFLEDPQKKYKAAEQDGIKIYRESQFYF